MRILVIGSGAREHAILWKLAQSPRKPELFAAPGNGGTAGLATNLPVASDDVEGMLAAARQNAIDLTVVGPEGALEAGMVDRFQAVGLRIFGPTQAAARIESSKAFAKQLMIEAGVPTAEFETFDNAEEARAHIQAHGAPVVVKASGLAAGKGVVVAQTVNEALVAVDDMMVGHSFGDSGDLVVIEDCLVGQEVSAFAFTDGEHVSPLVAACDYKRIFDRDEGPNTGGMGGYSPPPFWTDDLAWDIRVGFMQPVVDKLAEEGTPYAGVLYCGLMLTSAGPRVIEFNARFGDPEAQLIMPRLENDLIDVIDSVVDGNVGSLDLRWSDDHAVGVVLASGGYPGSYKTGLPVLGLGSLPNETMAFHAGTALDAGNVVTSGGRVLTAVGRGQTIAEARARAYQAADAITFDGAYQRSDIADLRA
jgi:phosphoribosylamine--glycine ligase